jgi:hypothetical protein
MGETRVVLPWVPLFTCDWSAIIWVRHVWSLVHMRLERDCFMGRGWGRGGGCAPQTGARRALLRLVRGG